MRGIRAGALAIAVVAAFGVVACGNSSHITPTGPTSSGSVSVEGTVLEQQKTGGNPTFNIGCDVLGRIRNDGSRDMNVTVKFNAFGNAGTVFATGDTGRVFVPAGGRSNFRASLFGASSSFPIFDCDDVKRLEVAAITAEPA